MAKRKTTELTTITAASLAAGDWFPVVDVSDTTDSPTGTNKKLAKSELAEAAGVTAHLANGTGAHAASAIANTPAGDIAATTVQAAINELDTEKFGKTTTQSAEGTATTLFTAVPKTAGVAPFQVIMNSFSNLGGTDPYSHMMMFGFNAACYTGGTVTANRPAVYMGFEDNYWDPADSTTGAEWYTGYVTPDGTSIAAAILRPFYWRVLNGFNNDPLKNVRVWADIGAGDTGSFSVYRGQAVNTTPLFEVGKTNIIARTQFSISAGTAVQLIQSTTGTATLFLDAKTTGFITFKINSAEAGGIIVSSANQFYFVDKAGTPTLVMVYGATVAASLADLRMSLKVSGNVGFYGTTPAAKPTVSGAKGSNAALGSLLTALSSLGLITDSTSA